MVPCWLANVLAKYFYKSVAYVVFMYNIVRLLITIVISNIRLEIYQDEYWKNVNQEVFR